MDTDLIKKFISQFEIHEPTCKYYRMRFGKDNDGGYIILSTGLEDTDVLYGYGSPEHEMTFDIEFYKKTGKTVRIMKPGKQPPEGITSFDYALTDSFTFLDHVKKIGDTDKKILIRMDTEGEEWNFLKNFTEEQANLVNQIVIEFHDLCNLKKLESRLAIMENFRKWFVPVHVHGNTWAPGVCFMKDQRFFPTLEMTFLNKRLCEFKPNNMIFFPTNVDQSNNPKTIDYELHFYPFITETEEMLKRKKEAELKSTENGYYKQEICRMSPKLGDMIFALPLVRRIANVTGKQVGLYLDAFAGGGGADWVNLFEKCISMIERQSYISWVKVVKSKEEHDTLVFTQDLELYFRKCSWDYCHPGNYFNGCIENKKDMRFGRMEKDRDLLEPWISGITPNNEWNDWVIVSSSTRYCPTKGRMDYLKEIEENAPNSKIAFLGYQNEMEEFKKEVPNIKFDKRLEPKDITEMASILLGAKYVCCNQSFPQTLCCALGVRHTSELPAYLCTANLMIPCQKAIILP